MGSLPIRKTSSTRVALTSYYGKNFVDRNTKVAFNLDKWIQRTLFELNEDNEHPLKDLDYGNVRSTTIKVPRIYSSMASEYKGFKMQGVEYYFDAARRKERYGEEALNALERDDHIVCGKGKGGYITVDHTDTFYFNKGDKTEELGSISDLLGITQRPPIEFATVTVLGKSIPVGVFLCMQIGINGLLKRLNAKHRLVSRGTRISLSDQEFALVFRDETLIVDGSDAVASLVLNGFNDYKRFIRLYDFNDFNHSDTVISVLQKNQLNVRYSREIKLMFDMFIDHITLELLTTMQEPTTMEGLLIRSCELLTTDQTPDETDMKYMRIKGYERFAGILYRQLTESARKYRQAPPSTASFDMNPMAVWMDVLSDQSVSLVEDSNPIHNLKEKERVTYSGQGGRTGRSMVKRSRIFHPNDVGVISEGGVDSGQVGVITYLSANPNLTSLRGTTRPPNEKEDPSSIVSTTAMLSPFADRDSAKRVLFASIQNSSMVGSEGYLTFPVRTGGETVIGQRVDPLYAFAAPQAGKVTSVDDRSVTFEYEDGTTGGVEIGRQFGMVTGTTVPHFVVCDLKVGHRFKQDDVLTFNRAFYERDFFDPTQVTFMMGRPALIALIENSDTIEDSSAISEELGKHLTIETASTRYIKVGFDQEIHNLVDVGEDVTSDSILCTIEDSVTSGSDLFDSDTIAALSAYSANAPKADKEGKVESIEVIYHGDKSDMSPSLKYLTDRSDRAKAKHLKRLGSDDVPTGEVKDTVTIDGQKLELDQAMIVVRVVGRESAGTDDKVVFALALKSVISRLMSGINETEQGWPLDGLFSYNSMEARVVNSPQLLGALGRLLQLGSIDSAKAYREG